MFEPAQVVGDLPGGDGAGVEPAQVAGERAQVAVGEAVGLAAEHQQCLQQGVAAPVGQPQAGDAGAGGGGDRRR